MLDFDRVLELMALIYPSIMDLTIISYVLVDQVISM